MQLSQWIEIAKLAVEVSIAVIAIVILRQQEEIKSAVARHSDFSQKWADLFFDASNAFMVSAERMATYAHFLTHSKDQNDSKGMEWRQEIIKAGYILTENYFRIKRLATLAPSNGPSSVSAADNIYQVLVALTNRQIVSVDELQKKTHAFNATVRETHSEMIASR